MGKTGGGGIGGGGRVTSKIQEWQSSAYDGSAYPNVKQTVSQDAWLPSLDRAP